MHYCIGQIVRRKRSRRTPRAHTMRTVRSVALATSDASQRPLGCLLLWTSDTPMTGVNSPGESNTAAGIRPC
jgi:hypothetical protein